MKHAYDKPDIGPRDFLIAVMTDPSVDVDQRTDAAVKLQQYDYLLFCWQSCPDWPDRRPLNYEPPPRTKSKRRKEHNTRPTRGASVEPISRYEWLCLRKHLEYSLQTRKPMNADGRALRDRVLIRNLDIAQRI